MLGSSIGQDTALSRREEGFDSPSEYQFILKGDTIMEDGKSGKLLGA